MENATKALIIAGAVLVAIILIGVGVAIVNSSSGIQERAMSTMNSNDVKIFNQQFEKYVGTKVKASVVKQLISDINASNASNTSKVTIDKVISGATTANITTADALAFIVTNKTYTVALTYNNTSGLVTKVTITQT